MLESIRRRIDILGLDLSGLNVVTEAATGAYACTAVIAAIAGARVHALARGTRRHGTALEAGAATLGLARRAGVPDRITIVERLEPTVLGACDILTNSGHLRPITRATIETLPSGAVIALMFEAWEFRGADLDLMACRDAGIPVAAVNERHPDVAVFPFLGPLCVRLLQDAGMPAGGRRIALLCDNPFLPFIRAGLEDAGAFVAAHAEAARVPIGSWDGVVVALDPDRNEELDSRCFAALAARAPDALIAQFWGDLDRDAARRSGFRVWPPEAPGKGHMGILLNALGHEPIVRLQAGGLRAAEMAFRGRGNAAGGIVELL